MPRKGTKIEESKRVEIKRMMRSKGLTNIALAEKLGKTHIHIGQALLGISNVSESLMKEIEEAVINAEEQPIL